MEFTSQKCVARASFFFNIFALYRIPTLQNLAPQHGDMVSCPFLWSQCTPCTACTSQTHQQIGQLYGAGWCVNNWCRVIPIQPENPQPPCQSLASSVRGRNSQYCAQNFTRIKTHNLGIDGWDRTPRDSSVQGSCTNEIKGHFKVVHWEFKVNSTSLTHNTSTYRTETGPI